MSRKRAAAVTGDEAPASAPATVRVRNPGRQRLTVTGASGSVAVPPGEVREVPAWVASHPAVTGARPVLVVVSPDEG